MSGQSDGISAEGRRAALLIAGVGLFWIVVTWLGATYEWSQRTRALFDLFALAGFGLGLWQTITLWRKRRQDKG